MTKRARQGEKASRVADIKEELSGLDWLIDQIIMDKDFEICATEYDRLELLGMLDRQRLKRMIRWRAEENCLK